MDLNNLITFHPWEVVKRIEMEPDRKSIVLWFSEDNALPLSDTRGTVS